VNEELKKLIDQLQALKVPAAQVEAMAKSVRNAKEGTDEHNAALENMKARVMAVKEAAEFAGESFRDLTKILIQNNDELDGKADFLKKALKGAKAVADVSRQMMFDEEEITEYTEKQLAAKIKKAKQGKEEMGLNAQALIDAKGIQTLDKNGNELQGAALTQKLKSLVISGKITAEEASLVAQYKDGFKAYQGVIDRSEEYLDTQKHVNETLGVTGGLIKGLGNMFSKIGIEGTALQHGIDDANSAMKKAAKDGAGKLKTALVGAGHVLGGVVRQLNDPVFIAGFLGKIAFGAADHINEIERSLSLSVDSATGVVAELEEMALKSGDAFITTAKLTHAVAALSDEMGIFATTADPSNLEGFVHLTENLGYATKEAASLIGTLELHGQTMESFNQGVEDSVNNFNKATHSNVTLKQVMDDVVNASTALKVTLGDTPNGLAEAATAARGLGVSLSQVEKIADTLLDFNSSIESEMEAQLMTGKSLNLAKAREAALMGDMKTVATEIGNQEAVREAFASKNVLAQNAVAKSLGMSREELAGMYKQQQLTSLGADKFKAIYGEQSLAATKARKASEEFAETFNKLKDAATMAFLPLGQVLLKITDGIQYLVALPGFGKFIKGFSLVAVSGLLLGKTVLSISGGIKSISKGFSELRSIGKSAMGFFSKMFGAASTAAESTASVVSNTASQASQGVSEMKEPKTSGSKVKEFLTNLAAGLKEMASMKVLGGALNLIPASLGFIAFIPGMIGAKLMEKLDGAKLQESLYGLAMGLEEMGKGKVALGAGALLLSAIGFTAMIPATAGMALFNLVAPMTNKLLPKFGQALASFGSLMMTGVGAIGLIALGAAAIALGYALGLAGPAIESAGTAIASILGGLTPIIKIIGDTIIGVFEGIPAIITAVADGFVNMFSAISMDNIIPILALGPALLGASIGIAAFAAALTGGSILSGVSSLMGGGIMSDLEALAAMSQPLATVGVSLTAIASGIAALSSALATLELEKIDELKDLVMTTAFAAPMVAASGAITELLGGITGGGGGEDSNKALLAEIKALRAAVEAGGDVYIDGNKAGRAINIATYKSA